MNDSSNPGNEIDLIETVLVVLRSGKSVELAATGYSMFPSLRPGDRVIFKPLVKKEIPEPGNIVVYRDNSGLVIHRLIKVIPDNKGNHAFMTRGDARPENDRIICADQILGVAFKYKRNRKEHALKDFIPSKIRYNLNHLYLWIFTRFKRLHYHFDTRTSTVENL